MEHEPNQTAAPETEQAAASPAAPKPPQKVRRVGTFAFGLTLIAAGALLIMKILVPGFDLYTVVKFAPVILIVLGVEVLIYAARPGVKIKYDFLSLVACAFILVVVGCSSLIPLMWDYYGPAHEQQMARFRNQLEQEARDALDTVPGIENLVRDADFIVWWTEGGIDSSVTDLHQVVDRVDTRADFTLVRGYGSEEEFAAACKSMIDACTEAGVPIQYYSFSTHNNSYETGPLVDYSLRVDNNWLARADAATLADCVTTSWYYDDAYFDSEQEYLDWQAEQEAERIAATAETAAEGSGDYDTGYEDGYQRGYEDAREELIPEY